MRVLIIGSGFLGVNLADALLANKHEVLLCSRHNVSDTYFWHELDATNNSACSAIIDSFFPDAIILVHGPSDITWCENHGEYAYEVHTNIACNIASLAKNKWVVLISSDNVFSGEKNLYFENDNVDPINAYGRAKLAAEKILEKKLTNLLVLRTSLVYGWDSPEKNTWLNFFSLCVRNLLTEKIIAVPDDHYNTPIWVVNFAHVVRVMLENKRNGLYHLSGPDRVSRYHWAQIIAEAFGYDASLIKRLNKKSSPYACRPLNACLGSKSSLLLNMNVLGLKDAAYILKENSPEWVKNQR